MPRTLSFDPFADLPLDELPANVDVSTLVIQIDGRNSTDDTILFSATPAGMVEFVDRIGELPTGESVVLTDSNPDMSGVCRTRIRISASDTYPDAGNGRPPVTITATLADGTATVYTSAAQRGTANHAYTVYPISVPGGLQTSRAMVTVVPRGTLADPENPDETITLSAHVQNEQGVAIEGWPVYVAFHPYAPVNVYAGETGNVMIRPVGTGPIDGNRFLVRTAADGFAHVRVCSVRNLLLEMDCTIIGMTDPAERRIGAIISPSTTEWQINDMPRIEDASGSHVNLGTAVRNGSYTCVGVVDTTQPGYRDKNTRFVLQTATGIYPGDVFTYKNLGTGEPMTGSQVIADGNTENYLVYMVQTDTQCLQSEPYAFKATGVSSSHPDLGKPNRNGPKAQLPANVTIIDKEAILNGLRITVPNLTGFASPNNILRVNAYLNGYAPGTSIVKSRILHSSDITLGSAFDISAGYVWSIYAYQIQDYDDAADQSNNGQFEVDYVILDADGETELRWGNVLGPVRLSTAH
jgi:hypothetical protein